MSAGSTKHTNEDVVPPMSPNTALIVGTKSETPSEHTHIPSVSVAWSHRGILSLALAPNTSTAIVYRHGKTTRGKAMTTVIATAMHARTIARDRAGTLEIDAAPRDASMSGK